MKEWKILNKLKVKSSKFKVDDLVQLLLENRGIKTKKEAEEFLHPDLKKATAIAVGINKKQLTKALKRIQLAIKNKEQIVVYGDYDVDGICGTAILWETLWELGAQALPYIPHRIEEGYGLSVAGIDAMSLQIPEVKLIITVDNGIVAHDAVLYAKKLGIDVIITDHHVPKKVGPEAFAIVHTVQVSGTGVAYLFAQELKVKSSKLKVNEQENDHLAFTALATVADLVPLQGANRTLLKHGLEALNKTKRPGLLALFQESIISQKIIGTYEIGHIIAPRLNAMGRLEYAMDSLRLLCTKDPQKAHKLAGLLGSTNRQRQQITIETFEHARLDGTKKVKKGEKLLFIADESYQPGVIGLAAGRLVEEFYRPSIVVSIGEKISKASARSVRGFNIIEFIREAQNLLIDAGGHPMAAGFTVETKNLKKLQKKLESLAKKEIKNELLTRSLSIDCELPIELINGSVFNSIQTLAPFGMRNPEPTFVARGVIIQSLRLIGRESKHVKLEFKVSSFAKASKDRQSSEFKIDGIGFGLGERFDEFKTGDSVDIVYTIAEDTWNGNKKLQLKIRDLKPSP